MNFELGTVRKLKVGDKGRWVQAKIIAVGAGHVTFEANGQVRIVKDVEAASLFL
jgi:hypothetical protein